MQLFRRYEQKFLIWAGKSSLEERKLVFRTMLRTCLDKFSICIWSSQANDCNYHHSQLFSSPPFCYSFFSRLSLL
ncbi:hypothetical protein WN943_023352 [Citrus x changshan-huyou]